MTSEGKAFHMPTLFRIVPLSICQQEVESAEEGCERLMFVSAILFIEKKISVF